MLTRSKENFMWLDCVYVFKAIESGVVLDKGGCILYLVTKEQVTCCENILANLAEHPKWRDLDFLALNVMFLSVCLAIPTDISIQLRQCYLS